MEYKYSNFYEIIKENAQLYPKRVAYFVDNKKITWKEVKTKVDSFAAALEEMGVKKGDKVPILIENSLEFIISFFAIGRLGAVVVPINTFLKEEEISYILNDIGAFLLITSDSLKDKVKNLDIKTIIPPLYSSKTPKASLPSLEDLAVIIYTSGTTGRPKGAMLTYKNFFANIYGINEIIKITPKDRFIAYLPMFHSFTLTVNILLPLFFKSPVVIIKSIRPFSNIIKQTLLKRVTIFTGVPDVYSALVKAKIPFYFHWFNKVRFYISGAAPLPGETLEKFSKKFKGKLLEGYGLSETSPVVSVNREELQKPYSVGKPLPNVEVKIVNDELVETDVGEIIVKGDNVMKGYYNNPEATESSIINGWFLTGDIGRIDEDGYLYILDRKKDLIISKGVNIYPREIEEVCLKIDGVRACAVVGMKENGVEIPVAFIETEKEIKANEIKSFLKQHLANYKIPKHIYFVEELPKNATGKVLKRVLKENIGKYMKA